MITYFKKAELIPTNAYKYYWYFAAERQNIFFNRMDNTTLTEDEILQTYKFTNAYRASDRVSQFLIRNVIYDKDEYSPQDVLFRILLFKIFNKIETWKFLEMELERIDWKTFDFRIYNDLLNKYMSEDNKVYSNAYMMPSSTVFMQTRKHSNHLLLLQKMLQDGLTDQIINASSLQEVFDLLKAYPSIGNFLAFQYAIDINYSNLISFSENDFVVAGPGSLDGISKCFKNAHEYTAEDIINIMMEKQEEEFYKFGLKFKPLWGRKLHLIDCQNIFCEVSKYTRVALPEIQGVAKRTRIKQRFKKKEEPIELFYPPKWNINDFIQKRYL